MPAPLLSLADVDKAGLEQPVKPCALTLPQMRAIAGLLKEHGLEPDPVGLFDFLQAGIELREQAKFQFTRNLSDALALIGELGQQWGFAREDLAYCDVRVFLELYIGAADARDLLMRSIEQGRARYAETQRVALPPLVVFLTWIWIIISY